MSEETTSEEKAWDKLSEDAKRVCSWIGKDTTAEPEMLEYIAEGEDGFDLTKALTELRNLGVIEEVTYLQKLSEVTSKKPTRDLLAPKLEPPITDEERQYLKAMHDLQDYERDPSLFKKWEEPRLRVVSQFREFVSETNL